ncbi:MarR family transcriptional regulator [Neorhizobium sp. DT-125]|uniref:MarR family transcriptional regulator n=1 Tax=Neorhizobium sp. DT-125 TaxID=3396163 RepID=UPI003F19DC0B
MDNPLDGETAQSRLKQVGMMSVLYYMYIGRRPLTLSNIVEETGLTRGGINESVDQLIKRNILIEKKIRNSMGRGRARLFEISPHIFEKLEAFEKA